MNKVINNLKYRYKQGSIVEKLIYLNIAVFLLGYLFNTLGFLMASKSNFVFDWFALPADFNAFIYKPWTLFTYAFLHAGLWHILSNLLVLFYIGNLFLEYFTPKHFLNYYVLGALFGGLIFMLSYNYFPILKQTNTVLVGASASVTAIFIGIATYMPNYEIKIRFIGFVKLWHLAAIWIGLDIIQIPAGNAGGHLAHLGGALVGFLLTSQTKKDSPIFDYFSNLFKSKKQRPLKTVYKSAKRTKTTSTMANQKKVDEILDKISKSGYETLTKEEKDFLFKSGKS